MNKALKSIGLVAVGLAALVGSAMAIPSDYRIGYVDPGSPADATSQTTYLQTLVDAYNISNLDQTFSAGGKSYTVDAGTQVLLNPTLPSPVGEAGGNPDGSLTTSQTVDLGSGGVTYLLIKWGNVSEFFYVAGLTGEQTFVNGVGNGNGSSHYTFWGTPTVPDGGMTLVLLGSSLTGLAFLARSRKFNGKK